MWRARVAVGAVEGGPQRRAVDGSDSQIATVRFDLRRLPSGGDLSLRVALAGDALTDDDARTLRLPPLLVPMLTA